MRGWLTGLLVLLVIAGIAVAEPARPITAQEVEYFEKRIRPILIESCQECHGSKKQQGGLRLDSRQALLKGADSGPVVVAGDPSNSLLLDAVRQTGALKMPPRSKLKPEQIEALTHWVKIGAPWPETPLSTTAEKDAWKRHWAFQPVKNPDIPAVRNQSWPLTTIDHFILAKLEAKEIATAAPANRRTLLRRATFDLIGLPPTPEELAAFEADQAPDAFAKVVDRLLASPHYGERWGRYWLDVARYADTKGYVLLDDVNYPWAYTYRDYVIRAFNEDLPYDQFISQQLAADKLSLTRIAERGTRNEKTTAISEKGFHHELAAMGFVTAGGRFMNNLHDTLDDRMDVVTRGLLGLTVTCARCHDHKFDPISQKDYYSLYGVFASSVEPPVLPVHAMPRDPIAYAVFEREHQNRQWKLDEFLKAKYSALVASTKSRAAEYLLAAHNLRDQPTTEDFMLLADGGDLNPTMIIRWQTYLARTRKSHHPVFAPWHAFAALPEKEFAEKAKVICASLLERDERRPINTLVAGALIAQPPKSLADVAQRYGELLNAIDRAWHEQRKRASEKKSGPPTSLADPLQEELRQAFYGPDAAPNVPFERLDLLELLPDRPAQAELEKLKKAVREWREKGPAAPSRAMVLEDLPTPYQPRIFLRGNPNNLGEPVPRQFLTVLAGAKQKPFQHGSGRLELAQAIASRDNPLTARVMVNRLWLHHFGHGLVGTPSDFGLRGDPPSHPELLDHLTTRFMDDGWSIKNMHRLIMLSAVYQQSSNAEVGMRNAESRKAVGVGHRVHTEDSENVLLGRTNRRRLDFETMCDTLLAVSGRLDHAIGGPPAKEIHSTKSNRRTLYGFIDRLNTPGLYRTFDFPSADASSPQRAVTTVAPQALFLMNSPFVLDCVRRTLQRPEVVSEKDDERRVERLYLLAYGRVPTARELSLAREFLAEGASSATTWERYTQALLLANEFVFVD